MRAYHDLRSVDKRAKHKCLFPGGRRTRERAVNNPLFSFFHEFQKLIKICFNLLKSFLTFLCANTRTTSAWFGLCNRLSYNKIVSPSIVDNASGNSIANGLRQLTFPYNFSCSLKYIIHFFKIFILNLESISFNALSVPICAITSRLAPSLVSVTIFDFFLFGCSRIACFAAFLFFSATFRWGSGMWL